MKNYTFFFIVSILDLFCIYIIGVDSQCSFYFNEWTNEAIKLSISFSIFSLILLYIANYFGNKIKDYNW